MKQVNNLFLFIILGIGLSGCANLETSVVQTNAPIKIEQSTVQKISSIKQDNDILSKDYAVAEKALKKAISEKNKNTISVGLKSPFLIIKQKIVAAIEELDDKTFVSDLIEALQENQVILDGGSETKFEQKELNRAIISALQRLIGLQFLTPEKLLPEDIFSPKKLSPEDIQKVLKKSREWWKIYQDKNK